MLAASSWRRVSTAQLSEFLYALTLLLEAGVPLTQAMQSWLAGQPPGRLARALSQVVAELLAGESLARALAQQPQVFEPAFCQLLAAGEHSGRLEPTLRLLLQRYEERAQLQQRLYGAMLYPLLLLLLALALLLGMSLWVIPLFKPTFAAAGQTLPLATQAVLALSDSLISHGWSMLAVLVVSLLLLLRLIRHSPRWRLRAQTLLARLPLLGPIRQLTALARWASVLSLSLSAAVPLAEALPLAGEASDDLQLAQVSAELARQVKSGTSLSVAMQAHRVFPGLLLQLVQIGEASGQLVTVLERACGHMTAQSARRLATLMTLLEPLCLLFLGLMSAFLLWALYLPVFRLGDTL